MFLKLTIALTLLLQILQKQAEGGSSSGLIDGPWFVEPIRNVTIAAGMDVKLSCKVENIGTYKVAWINFSRYTFLTLGSDVITRNHRVSVSHDGHSTWTLQLKSVKTNDAGIYLCQINTDDILKQYAVLEVLVPPNIVDSLTSNDVVVKEHDNVTLTCSATGKPTPSITWRREDGEPISINETSRLVEHVGPILHLAKVSRKDMAAYLCIARSDVPPIVSKRIKVSVDFPPEITIKHQLVGAPVGYSVTLECTIEAHPQALTYWTHEPSSIRLHKSRKYHIIDKPGDVSYKILMKITITQLTRKDFGSYKCVAKNPRGQTEGIIKLYEVDPPTTASTSPSPSFLDPFKSFEDFGSHNFDNANDSDDDDSILYPSNFGSGLDNNSLSGSNIHPNGNGGLDDDLREGFDHNINEQKQQPQENKGHYFNIDGSALLLCLLITACLHI